jgi:hypothetical protein
MSSAVNKFAPINVENANRIVGTYGNVSLLVNAEMEVKGNSFLKNIPARLLGNTNAMLL